MVTQKFQTTNSKNEFVTIPELLIGQGQYKDHLA